MHADLEVTIFYSAGNILLRMLPHVTAYPPTGSKCISVEMIVNLLSSPSRFFRLDTSPMMASWKYKRGSYG
jgi:hypothetical protein